MADKRSADEAWAMAYELGAARFLLEHYFAGTANEHVRREAQAWLDRARGLALARTGHPCVRSDDCDQSDDNDDTDPSGQHGADGPSQQSPFDRFGE